MFRPFGNLVRLPDGRTLRKQGAGSWIDVNSGVQMNDTMVGNLMYSSAFYGIPEGGRGKKARGTVIGIAGDILITKWLQDVINGVDSLDMAFVGDSNIAYTNTENESGYLNQGLVDHFMLAGICAGMKMYGSPVQFMAGATGSPSNYAGYNCYCDGIDTRTRVGGGYTSGNSFGPSSFTNEYGIGSGTFSPLGRQGYFAGYAWIPTGVTGSASATWFIGNTGGKTGLNTGTSLTARMIIGSTGATGGGSIRFIGFDETGRYKDTVIPITFTGGFTAYETDCTKSGGIGNTAMNYSFAGNSTNGFAATGPLAFAMSSFYNPVKGFATHSLQHSPGWTLGGLFSDITKAGLSGGNNTIVNAFKEYYNRQVKAGGTGRVCVFIEGGVNIDTSADASVTYGKNLVNFLTSEWSRAGLPANKLTFLVMNTWTIDPASTWSTYLPTVAENMTNYAKSTSNITYVNVLNFGGGDYAGWTAAGYYDSGGPGHLSKQGYANLCKNVMNSLVKSRTR